MKHKHPGLQSISIDSCEALKIHPYMQEFLGYCLYKLALRIRSRIDDDLEPYGLVAVQGGIITMLKKLGPMTQVQLGQHMGVDKATMVRLLDVLEEKKNPLPTNLEGRSPS